MHDVSRWLGTYQGDGGGGGGGEDEGGCVGAVDTCNH